MRCDFFGRWRDGDGRRVEPPPGMAGVRLDGTLTMGTSWPMGFDYDEWCARVECQWRKQGNVDSSNV